MKIKAAIIWLLFSLLIELAQGVCKKRGKFCGGIAGFKCCGDLICVINGTFPDAGGTCKDARCSDPPLTCKGFVKKYFYYKNSCQSFDCPLCPVGKFSKIVACKKCCVWKRPKCYKKNISNKCFPVFKRFYYNKTENSCAQTIESLFGCGTGFFQTEEDCIAKCHKYG